MQKTKKKGGQISQYILYNFKYEIKTVLGSDALVFKKKKKKDKMLQRF